MSYCKNSSTGNATVGSSPRSFDICSFDISLLLHHEKVSIRYHLTVSMCLHCKALMAGPGHVASIGVILIFLVRVKTYLTMIMGDSRDTLRVTC